MMKKTNTPGTKAGRRKVALCAAAALGSTIMLGTASTANASQVSFSPLPRVQVSGPMIIGSETTATSAAGGYAVQPQIRYGGLSVTASPFSNDPERVYAIYILERFDGADWKTVDASTETKMVQGFQSITFDRRSYPVKTTSQSLYRARYGVVWTDAASGERLDYVDVTSNVASDGLCQTVKIACEVTDSGQLRL